MNVLLVSPIDPCAPKPGGTRAYVMNIINSLKTSLNFFLIGVSYKKSYNNTYKEYNFLPILTGEKIRSYKFLFRLFFKVPFLSNSEDTIIHVQAPEHMLPFFLFHRHNPKVFTVHGKNLKNEMVVRHGKLKGAILDIVDDYVVQRVNKLIVVDEKTKEYYTKRFPRILKKIVVIPSGINTDIFRPMDKYAMRDKYNFHKYDKIILYIGRYNKEKGLELLIDSFRMVISKIPESKLVMIGDGPERQNLKSYSEGLNGVIFMDPLPHEKIPEVINCADIFALTSLYEGMPTVVLESLACGVPVVSTNVGDVNKVVLDGISGYLVNKRTPEEIAVKIIAALNNSQQFKTSCINIAHEYSWDKIGNRIISVYEEAIESRNRFCSEN